ncbi:MAG: DUF4406 domain-containing protein [Burkholderiales bacterium]|nr:DUF4406 domain-containing protein [Burkholderiales bacterium]
MAIINERDQLARWKSTNAPRLEALDGLLADARAEAAKGAEAISSLASEREANAILTAENDQLRAQVERLQGGDAGIDGNTSDGYHTFNELYEFRKAYNAALFNEWASSGKCNVHKSWRHHDGELCFGGGWFIVVAVLPDGQISNHYEANDWDLFTVPESERALFEFDGHTGSDVISRLKLYTAQPAAPATHWTEHEPVRLASFRTGRVYLAGPMTGIADFNFPAFNAEADLLRPNCTAVINPAEHGIVAGANWSDYLRHDIAGLVSCERIHLLRGWSKSKGAQLEYTIAKALGMAVTFQDGAEMPAVPAMVHLTDEQRTMFKNVEGMLDAYVACIRQYGDYEVWHYIPEVEATRDDLASYLNEVHGIGQPVGGEKE